MARQRALGAALAALLFLTTSCDKGGSDLPLEPSQQELRDATIEGEVMVGDAGLPGVEITLAGPESDSVLTDAQGAFAFANLKRGTYTVTLLGFDPARHAFPSTRYIVSAVDGTAVEVDFIGTLVPQAPSAPSGLLAAAVGPDAVELSWNDGSDNEARFSVERRTEEGSIWTEVGVTGADTTHFSDSELTPVTTYLYRVRACNEVGCSPFAEEAAATTADVPPVEPTGLTAEPNGSSEVQLAWTDASDNETGFEVERRTGEGSWTRVGSVAADTASFADTGLTPNTTYAYRVRACNGEGCSSYSEEAVATTDDIRPRAPSDLTAEAHGPAEITVGWADRSDNETGFEVERRTGAGSWNQVGSPDADATTFQDTGLTPSTTYAYRVRACNGEGCSDYTAEASATTGEAAPSAPTGLEALAGGPDRIALAWTDASDNEREFRVERKKASGGLWSRIATPEADATTFQDTGLSASTGYTYRVQACNGGGCSPFSNEASATTEGLDGPNLFISELYLTQSTQSLGGDVPLVAGKDGYLRVFALASEANDFQPAVRVRFYLGGSLVHTETIPSPGASVPLELSQASLGYSWNVAVPASLIQPGLEILAEVDPGNLFGESDEADNTFPADGSPAVMDVRSVPPLEVTFIPVRQNATGLVGNVTSGNAASFLSVAMEMLPLAESDVRIHAEYSTDAPELVNDNDNGAWGTVLSEIYAVRVAEGGSGHYFGVVKTSYTSGVAGMGYLGWPAAIGWDRLPSASGVAAHEMGHNWNRYHAPGCGVANPDANYPYADGKIGVWGLEVDSESLKSPSTHYDFMSYCGPDWVSDYNYRAILEYRQAVGGWTGSASTSAEPSLLVWGRVEGDRIVLEPAFRVTAQPSLPAAGAEYVLEGFGGDGSRLFALPFQPMPVPDGSAGEGHFALAVPLSSFDASRLAGLRVSGGGRTPGRMEAVGGPEGVAAPEPQALVRDPGTGHVLSFARGGSVRLHAPAETLEIVFSDGIRSTTPVRRRVQ